MSDFEDEMDVDAPVVDNDIKFSSGDANAKGKRSAANLPVEAEDSLPWYQRAQATVEEVELINSQGRKIPTKFS